MAAPAPALNGNGNSTSRLLWKWAGAIVFGIVQLIAYGRLQQKVDDIADSVKELRVAVLLNHRTLEQEGRLNIK